MIKFLDLKKQYMSIKDEIDQQIESILLSSSFIGGERLAGFESNFAGFVGADFCVGVGNGTDALEIAIESLDLPKGSEIIVPANSFIASSEAVTRQGHRVVFCDVNSGNYTLCEDALSNKISSKTRAVIAVHLYGHPCDIDSIKSTIGSRDIAIIEDCAQAHGAKYKGRSVGSLGDVATFSFYPGKNLGAYGDAGAICTSNPELAKKCRMIANHGRIGKYDHEFEGRNSRMDTLQASVLNVKLKYLDQWTDKRIKCADIYLDGLKDVQGIVLPKREEWAKQVYHLFVIRVDRRAELKEFLKDNGIQTGIHYPIALPKLPAYKYLEQDREDTFANKSDEKLLSLPVGEHLDEEDVVYVVKKIKEFFKQV